MTGRLRTILPITVVAVVLLAGWLIANEPWADGDGSPAGRATAETQEPTSAPGTRDATPETPARAEAGARYDLERDERRGGHTIERHVGRTEAQLRERLEQEDISAASTYFDLETAELVVGLVLRASEARVAEWVDGGGGQNLALRYTHTEPVGITLERGARTAREVASVVVVLRWAGGEEWYVLTSYPDD